VRSATRSPGGELPKVRLRTAAARGRTALGEPTSVTATLVCLYYDGALEASYVVPPDGTLWRDAAGGRGWVYDDAAAMVTAVLVRLLWLVAELAVSIILYRLRPPPAGDASSLDPASVSSTPASP